MLTKTKIALIAALVLGPAGTAMAEDGFDPNLANRYPAYNGPAVQGPQGFTSSDVRLGNGGYANQGLVSQGRPQVHTFHYDSAPVISGGGY